MAGRWHPTERRVLALFADGKPQSHRDVVRATGLSETAVWSCLKRCWERRHLLRTTRPIRETLRARKGRAGIRTNLRSYHLYMLKLKERQRLEVGGVQFAEYSRRFVDKRGGNGSKAALILNFLKKNAKKAFFSKDIAEALKNSGVKKSDVMSNVRRWERRGLVYVRGYKTHDRQTPFKEGFLLTWISQKQSREEAIEQAVLRTEKALDGRMATSPIIERVHRIRDVILAATKTRDLVAQSYIANELGCSEYETEGALQRALQLYPDLKEVKLFNAYRYYYHASLPEEELRAAMAMKENYIRLAKGRDNRIGHNWEAAVEWFVDKFTTGASFREQPHRNAAMDSRRITLHLIKSVGGRMSSAEVDRVWTVTPGIFSPPTTYVLSCKWGLIRKRDVDDFLKVILWSTDFGVDTPDGRQLKQGVTGVFAGTAFKPDEKVLVANQTISLASYANRLNISLLKAPEFNEKLRERGCKPTATIQGVCRAARDENQVREVLESIWQRPTDAEKILADIIKRNDELYRFERTLEEGARKEEKPIVAI